MTCMFGTSGRRLLLISFLQYVQELDLDPFWACPDDIGHQTDPLESNRLGGKALNLKASSRFYFRTVDLFMPEL